MIKSHPQHRIFLTYARANDENSQGAISRLKALIEKQVKERTGQRACIFKDNESMPPGARFKDVINETIDNDAIVMIAFITPSFFQSDYCKREVRRFLEREKRLGRRDLIIPVYLIEVDEIQALINRRGGDPKLKGSWLAKTLLQRTLLELRTPYEKRNFNSKECREQILQIAITIKDVFSAFEEIENKEPATPRPSEHSQRNEAKALDSTEYGKRTEHFLQEKEFLADRFGEYLWARLKHLNQATILLIDSGTTLYPFFSKFGRLAVNASTPGRDWIKNLMVITNNLAGVEWLMKNGKASDDKWAEVALPCIMLPGTPLPTYYAATGIPTDHRFSGVLEMLQPNLILETLRATCNCKVIALVTGNWVRIRNHFPHYPVPLARGRGHLDIKQAMINCADEVYVVAPLGKIFADRDKSEVQFVLHDFVDGQEKASNIYQEVRFEAKPLRNMSIDDEPEVSNKIRLVTTSRKERFVLSSLSKLLEKNSFLDTRNVTNENFEEFKRSFYVSKFTGVSNLMFEFDGVPIKLKEQIQTEFPHKESWGTGFLKCFHLANDTIERFLKSISADGLEK
jgi:hypothetical protein